ncbi:MAG: alpha/beta fold hydrolase [Spirochaetaceae bacterium]|nr:alpha/beta fold hydrolase [Spirochaetaceae bacterium]
MAETKVIKDALPLQLEGTNGKAVLIIHGYTGYAGEYYELAHTLNEEGYTISLPRLPGHGTNRQDFLKTGWKDWLQHIQNTYFDLKARFSSVSIVGLSMGGVLALILSSRFNPEKIVLLAPAMAVSDKVFYFTPLLKFFKKEVPKFWQPEEKDSADIRFLGREYWSCSFPGQLANLYKLMRMAKKGLNKITSPTLILLSEIDDSVPLSSGDIIEKGLSHCEVKKIILKNSPHVLLSGEEKDIVKQNVIQWLTLGAFPFALLSLLIFLPPSSIALINTLWLFVFTFLFYLFMTMYVTPFFALLSELGHTPNERLELSTMISVTWALGFMIGNSSYALQGILERTGVDSVRAFQIVIAGFALISVILMYLPVLFIDEKRYCETHVSEEGSFKAVISAFKNKDFLYFTLSDLTYFLALTFIQTGISFYIIQLLKLPKEMASTIMLVMFLLSFLFYVPVSLMARKIGKKNLLIAGFALFIFSWLFLSFWGLIPMSMEAQAYITMILAALPLAIFGILPNAIVADIAEADGKRTGNYKAGVYFGARTFMSKMGASVTLLIFPFISHIGGETGGAPTEAGIRFTTYAAMVFLVIGLMLFMKYDEKSTLAVCRT